MALLNPSPLPTSRFTWVPAEGLFVAEASDLGRDFRLGQVYDDACDVGLTLVSHVTGARRVFVHTHTERDGEGEFLWEDFSLVIGASGRTSDDFRVRIFND